MTYETRCALHMKIRRELLEPQHESLALALLLRDGADLEAITQLADEVRRDTVGDVVTYVVNRNINFTNVCYTGCRFCAFAQRASDPMRTRCQSLTSYTALVRPGRSVRPKSACKEASTRRFLGRATPTWFVP